MDGYIYIYIYTYTYIHIHAHIYIYVCVCILNMCMCIYIYIYAGANCNLSLACDVHCRTRKDRLISTIACSFQSPRMATARAAGAPGHPSQQHRAEALRKRCEVSLLQEAE